MTRVHDLLDRWQKLEARKQPWMGYWQQLGDVLLPNQSGFTTRTEAGQPRNEEIFDGAPRLAARQLATTIDGLLKPKTNQWFHIETSDENLNDDHDTKVWLENTRERMWSAIYRRDARFIQRSGEVDQGLVVYGQTPLWIGLNSQINGLAFRALSLSASAFDEDADGVVNVFSVLERFTPRQAIQVFGKENVHPEVHKKAKDKTQSDKKLRFVQLILPREDRDAHSFASKDMVYASVTIDVDHEHVVKESGFEEFPVAIPRWETSPGEIYARSPGMMALPDAKTLQAMGKTLLIGGQRAVDPPTWAFNDAVLSPVRTFPGGLTVLDAEVAQATGGKPLGTLDMGSNIPIGREMQDDYRRQVEAAFFKNVFNLPIEGRQMTATEILERKEEFTRTIGPVFGRLESDYIGHIVERVFGIMLRAQAFAPMPERLLEFVSQGGGLKFQYQSPVQQAKKQIEIAGLARTWEVMLPLMNTQPEVMDNFDGDAIARDAPEFAGISQKYLRSVEDRDGLRQQRAEAAQAAQTGQELAEGAGAAKDISSAVQSIAGAEAEAQAVA